MEPLRISSFAPAAGERYSPIGLVKLPPIATPPKAEAISLIARVNLLPGWVKVARDFAPQ
jgi:hypothetical protein